MAADVISTLNGGLGNQLFQYCAARHAALATGGTTCQLLLLQGHGADWRQHVDISSFLDVDVRRPTRIDRARWDEFTHDASPLNHVFKRTSRMLEGRGSWLTVRQRSPFDEAPEFEAGRHVKLQGFFQHPDWFLDSWRNLAREVVDRAPAGFTELADRRRIVVHVRRTDYVREGWDLGPHFYRDALRALGAEGREVVLVSDEPRFREWFRESVHSLDCSVVGPEILTGRSEVDDFWNVAAARTAVVANSSYSWWAAAVATARDDRVRVAYPRPWFPNRWTRTSPPDLGLPGWTASDSGLPEVA
jgi:hypothetical protein